MGMMWRILEAVRPYTHTPGEAIECTVERTLDCIQKGVPGDLVECGTHMGGLSFAMLLAQRYALGRIERPVWMYDSFEGMSEPSAEDGAHADGWWESAKDAPKDAVSHNYCIAPVDLVRAAAASLDLTDYCRIVPGWLHETLPETKPDQIALLRVDCDWYEPVKCSLEHMVPRVSPGGAIIIDDYHAWEGATLATHEYLAAHRLPWPLHTIPGANGAWFKVGPTEW